MKPDECLSKVLDGAIVHATADVNGKKCYAQLMVKNGVVHLPALSSSNQLSAPNHIFAVSSLLTCFTNTNLFLTLSNEGKELGTVYVKLQNNAFAKYIRKFCLGTIGPSYRKAVFCTKASFWLATGDVSKYDTSPCTEPPPTLPVNVPVKHGMVCITGGTSLGFALSNNLGLSRAAVGRVIDGMDVVWAAHKLPPKKVHIREVGVVLK